MDEVIPYARRFNVPGVDVEALVRATPVCWEYPMCDRDPLPHWSHGRVTLIGDAAHPMYPVGSNGAAQAILDARCLADWLRKADHPMQALHEYERDRLPKTAEIVRLNRKGGPERVIDEVEKLAPAGFEFGGPRSQPRRARGDRQRLRQDGWLHAEPGEQVKAPGPQRGREELPVSRATSAGSAGSCRSASSAKPPRSGLRADICRARCSP